MIADDSVFSPECWDARRGNIQVYTGFTHFKETLPEDAVRQMVRERHVLGAIWSYDWDCGIEGP